MPDREAAASAASIEAKIFELLAAREPRATLCPSEVARALAEDEGPWRALMPAIREVARDLAAAGRLAVTHGGTPVDATRAGGPIRLGRPLPADD